MSYDAVRMTGLSIPAVEVKRIADELLVRAKMCDKDPDLAVLVDAYVSIAGELNELLRDMELEARGIRP